MAREARSEEITSSSAPVRDKPRFDDRPLSDLEAVVWRAPRGWSPPDWLDDEPCPATLPMTADRFHWCLQAIGWSAGELARRIHTHDSSVRQMGRGRRVIPDTLAIWLEGWAAAMLRGPLLPDRWREKPMLDEDGVPMRNPR